MSTSDVRLWLIDTALLFPHLPHILGKEVLVVLASLGMSNDLIACVSDVSKGRFWQFVEATLIFDYTAVLLLYHCCMRCWYVYIVSPEVRGFGTTLSGFVFC